MGLNRDEIENILTLANHAISPYNTQPWRFRIKENHLFIYIIRTKNFFLKLNGISQMTLGFFLENLSAAAQNLGYHAEIKILGNYLNLDSPMAEVAFKTVSENHKTSLHEKVITQRYTNRHNYRNQDLEAHHFKILNDYLNSKKSQHFDFQWVRGDAKIVLADILSELEEVRFGNAKIMKESLEFIRLGKEENSKYRDHLDVETLALEPKSRNILPFLMRWPSLHTLLRPLMLSRERKSKRINYESSSALLVFKIQDGSTDYEKYIEIGKIIQAILNRVEELGMASHATLGGLYLISLAYENIEIFSPQEIYKIFTCKRDLGNLLKTSTRNIAFIARIGYCDKPAYPSLRKPIKELVLKN